MKTDHAPYFPTVKELHSGGGPFILLEPAGSGLELLKSADIILDLRDGTSMEEAFQIATYFRRHVRGLATLTHIPSLAEAKARGGRARR
jgi:hypothetical protein